MWVRSDAWLDVLPLWAGLYGCLPYGYVCGRAGGGLAPIAARAIRPGGPLLLRVTAQGRSLGAAQPWPLRRVGARHPQARPLLGGLGAGLLGAAPVVVVVAPLSPRAAAILAGAAALGVSGSRRPSAASLSALAVALRAAPSAVPVLVGDAAGIDAHARQIRPGARVFVAADYGDGPQSFAARSIACVRATVAAGGIWCAFPASPCPAGLAPSASSRRMFAGYGAGTWSSLALAVGLGLSALVYLPSGVPAPWAALTAIQGGWWSSAPAAAQLSLF